MQDWAPTDILGVIALPLAILSTFIAALKINSQRARVVIMTLLMLIIVGDVAALAWLVRRSRVEVVKNPPPKKPGPAPSPRPAPSPVQKTTRASAFQVAPASADAARASHCLVAEFEGTYANNQGSFDVSIDKANASLCRYSKHGARRFLIRVGIMRKTSQGSSLNKTVWSKPIDIMNKMNPGDTYSNADPLQVSIAKPRSLQTFEPNLVIQVINRPYDSTKGYQYVLYGIDRPTGQLVAR